MWDRFASLAYAWLAPITRIAMERASIQPLTPPIAGNAAARVVLANFADPVRVRQAQVQPIVMEQPQTQPRIQKTAGSAVLHVLMVSPASTVAAPRSVEA